MPPRASKRKATAPQNSSSITSADDSPTASDKTKTKKTDRVDSLFDSYANSSLGIIEHAFQTGISNFLQCSHLRPNSPEGIEALCSDMNVEHTDVRILMFAWKLKAQRQGYFTRDEWRSGMKALKVDSLSKLKKGLPELEKEVNTPENFQDFYSYAFRYCLTEEKQKTVDIESVCELLNLVLGSQFQSKVDLLIEYLKIQSDYKAINLDQWMGFLRFCKEISFPDLENYDADLAWPLILDNFVDWMKEKLS
ncbi:DCN1-like protein 4 [Populus alba x Populus x berolinensis]|uniref:Defective in cullin neddylation protein n=1 Tax=Populus alba x Populus x berolinensis TaxID=444605 RepID=A0AAD6LFC9_9ROSI|nr:DCN1-like protein 4 [Populus alba x Populus x berolinensis]